LAREHPEHLASVRRVVALARELIGAEADQLPTIPGYVLVRLLGQGSLGLVYLAQQQAVSGRLVALKVLRGTGAGSARGRARFLNESRALAKIQHPAVVTIHDVVETDAHC